MDEITVAEALTAFEPWLEPTDAELASIEAEMPNLLDISEAETDRPLLSAVAGLMDAQLMTRYRPASELDERRLRRARRRVLAAHRDLTNRASGTPEVGA
ncbi:DUF6284 family protein [Streptomyces chattanoogensis]|uniref:DUF6284 family protein n=1 Tax=Streptomyces chattanoogensis TaxID=66876 RepID=UPI003684AA85